MPRASNKRTRFDTNSASAKENNPEYESIKQDITTRVTSALKGLYEILDKDQKEAVNKKIDEMCVIVASSVNEVINDPLDCEAEKTVEETPKSTEKLDQLTQEDVTTPKTSKLDTDTNDLEFPSQPY